MKTIRINGVETTVDITGLNFQTFLNDLNQSLMKDKQVISSIKVNGHEITESEEGIYKAQPLETIGEIEVMTSNPLELARETVNTLDIYIDRLITSIEKAAQHYRGQNLVAGDNYFVKSIDGLDLLVQTISGIKLALKVGLHTKIALAEAELISIMNDLLDAKRQNNYIYLSDLLETELIQNLQDWKSQIFPIFRNWGMS